MYSTRADRREAERKFQLRRDAANRAHYGDKIPANLRPATAEEAAAIIAAWREGGPAKDSEYRIAHDAGMLRSYLAKLDHEDALKAAKAKADAETRARDAAENYKSKRAGLLAKIGSAGEAEAFLATLGTALAAHASAERSRRDLRALIDRATEAAAAIVKQPPPMSAAPAAPRSAERVAQVFAAFRHDGKWFGGDDSD